MVNRGQWFIVPGSGNLQRIGNDEAAALADSLFAHGNRGGMEAIQTTINKVVPRSVKPDGDMGPETFNADLTGRADIHAFFDRQHEKFEGLLEEFGARFWEFEKHFDLSLRTKYSMTKFLVWFAFKETVYHMAIDDLDLEG